MDHGLELFTQENPLAGFVLPKKQSRYWRLAQTLPPELSPQQQQQIYTAVAGELAILQVAFPTQARNFTKEEVDATCALWFEIFKQVHPQILHEAVSRFILGDKKGFFPSPGLIVDNVEKIMGEIESEKLLAEDMAYITTLLQNDWQEDGQESKGAEPCKITSVY